jgi:hypothetical protein
MVFQNTQTTFQPTLCSDLCLRVLTVNTYIAHAGLYSQSSKKTFNMKPILLGLAIALLLIVIYELTCNEKPSWKVEDMPETYTDTLRKLYDSLSANIDNVLAQGNAASGVSFYTDDTAAGVVFSTKSGSTVQWHPDTQRLPSVWTDAIDAKPATDDMRLTLDSSYKLGGVLTMNTEINNGAYLLYVDSTGMLMVDTMYRRDEYWVNGELFAYCNDSAWIFTNPDKVILLLDSLFKIWK